MGILGWIRDYFRDIKKSTGKTFKNIVLTAHFWVILVAVVLIVSMTVIVVNLLSARKDQYMADYWQNGSKTYYRQLTVFAKANRTGLYSPLTALEGFDEDNPFLTSKNIEKMRKTLQGTVDSGKKSVASNKKKTTPVGWEDCYSTSFDSKVTYIRETVINSETMTKEITSDVEIVATGGNFKAFHPFEFMSGGFLPVDEVQKEICVINDNLAWELFKSYDICGYKISMMDEDYTIVGVVREKKTDVDKTTGSDRNRVYCYFSKLEEVYAKGFFDAAPAGDGEEASTRPDLACNCYEVILPETVRGVARSDVLNALPSYNSSNPQQRIVSNTGRFSIKQVYDQNIPVGKFQNDTAGYEFPYWEKASILTTQRLFVAEAVMLFGIILLFIGFILLALRIRRAKLEPHQVEEPEEEEEAKDDNIKVFS